MNKTVTLDALPGVLKRDMAALARRITKAVRKAAKAGAQVVHDNTPKAFGELRDSIKPNETPNGAEIRVSAPHAQAVELGSRPHLVPIQDLVAWVKLRGMQGVHNVGEGPTTRTAARQVASQLADRVLDGSLNIDAPMEIAKAIQRKIAKNGTRPHHFVANSIPKLHAELDRLIRQTLSNN